jgi:hypothetical protein
MKKKLKNYEVLIKAYAVIVVEGAKDEEEAVEFASQDISLGDFEIDEYEVERELKTLQEMESAKKHCQRVSKPD